MSNIDETFKMIMIAIPAIGCIAWFIRLESKVLYLEKDQSEHKAAVKENQILMWRKIEDIQSDTKQMLLTLARIEESIKNMRNEKDQ